MKSLLTTICSFLLLGCMLLASPAHAAEFSPTLDYELSNAKSADFVSAIVILESPIDIRALDDRLHVEKATKARRHTEVLAALHYNADNTQPKVRTEFDQAIHDGAMKGYTPYWIENCFVIYATKDFIEGLRTRGDIKYATENFKPELIEPIRPTEEAPNHAGRNSLDTRTLAVGIQEVGALRVNEELGITGNGVLIGDCDTGTDATHPALAARWRGHFAPWWQCWKDDVNHNTTVPTDGNGHGTHTMGTMTGRGVSGTDTTWVGCAPNAHWMSNNAISQNVGSDLNNDVIADYQWFTDPDTVSHDVNAVPDVINNSWGVNASFGAPYTTCFDYWNTVMLNCEAGGSVVMFAAGNEGSSGLRSPAIYSINSWQFFAVGAVDGTTNPTPPYPIASFSSLGPTPCTPANPNNIKPEISAPGVNVLSSVPGGIYQSNWSGTSMATPHITGIAALMREACPNCDPQTIKTTLMANAIRTGYVTPPATENNTFGNGFVDGYNAVLSVMGNHGRVTGTILDANTNNPLVAMVQVVGGSQSTVSSATGVYWLLLPGDSTYTINYSLFGYTSQNFTVHIVTNDTTTQNVNLVPRPVVTVFNEDFETGAPGWTHNTPGGQWVDQWNISTQRSHSSSHSYKCGDTGAGNYANLNDARLVSPTITNIPADASLHFWYQIQSEISASRPDSAYDGGIVEVSANGGAFTEINPIGNYPKTFRWCRNAACNPATGPMLGQPCYAGNVTTWTEGVFDLSAYAAQSLQFRFRFGSDQSTDSIGWFVDDISVTGFGPTQLPAPISVVIYTDGDNVILTWAADANTAYRIYSDTDPMGSFATFVGSTTATADTLVGAAATSDKTFYIVRGWNGQ